MKFILESGKMVMADFGGYIGGKPEAGSIMEKVNNFSDWVINTETNLIFKPIGEFIGHSLSHLGVWFIENLPDIMGYGTMVAGVFCIIGAMTGKGGMMKPLGWLAGGLIAAICILGGV